MSSSGYANHGGFRQPQSGQAASRPWSKRRIGKPESSGDILRSVRMTGSYRSQLNNPSDSGHKILLQCINMIEQGAEVTAPGPNCRNTSMLVLPFLKNSGFLFEKNDLVLI